ATETRAGYFEALEASNTMVATFSATINGQPFEKRIIFEDVEAGQWRKINFSTQATPSVPQPEGSIDLGNGISINIGYVDTDLTQSGSVGDEEIIENPGRPGVEDPKEPDQPGPDEPGPDQPGDENAISFTYNGDPVEGSTVNDNASGTAYLVVISAEKGMKGLEVEISSDNDDFIASVTELMPLKFNLANPESDELAENLASIGLPVRDQVVGKTSVDFDISGLVPLLVTFNGEHTFKVTANDADGNSKTLDLVIKS
ncbi:MAG: DUF4493 domain-containing protein, partial [Muribaculaceae bacterium]|nr:DUF4493 domain-containing protein [Muribaculaceae bacterium]